MKLIGKATVLAFLLVLVSFAISSWAVPQEPAGQESSAPDNTKANKRDRNKSEITADQQKENRSDRELSKQIRRALVKDKSLSTYAHNVKVVVQNGQVTLKGPVRSEDEKKAIETKTTEVAGEGKVTSELEVKAEQ